ncbi:hypothetical protein [Deinococcus hopiensis]|uniref:Uncharacterized protein n=1 Tax=Deinococcus hopiensis KR-140 TaxID=695939 RepID=A0A1W1VJC1_9DEIO|nr:hypothetical protein [Deinococcus hopiensis]SMB93151.1 hypothetical protein SAMN00790413_01867 [Deinococcus hopiensis KR-140]
MFKEPLKAVIYEGLPFAVAGGTLVSIAAGDWRFLEYALILLGCTFIALCLQPYQRRMLLRVKYAHLKRPTRRQNSSKG